MDGYQYLMITIISGYSLWLVYFLTPWGLLHVLITFLVSFDKLNINYLCTSILVNNVRLFVGRIIKVLLQSVKASDVTPFFFFFFFLGIQEKEYDSSLSKEQRVDRKATMGVKMAAECPSLGVVLVLSEGVTEHRPPATHLEWSAIRASSLSLTRKI